MMILTALLGIGFIFALAGDFVLWAKVDEYKRTAQDEHANYPAALNLHNTTAEVAQEKDAEIAKLNSCINSEIDRANRLVFEIGLVEDDRDYLQDRLSALLCPSNNHVWKDGRCVKCGRVKDG